MVKEYKLINGKWVKKDAKKKEQKSLAYLMYVAAEKMK